MKEPALGRIGFKLYLRNWGRITFFSACIAIGVAFLFAVGNLLAAVNASVASRARELMAADVEVSSHQPFDSKADAVFESLKAEGVRLGEVVLYSSMLQPEKKGAIPYLVSVKAVDRAYPFYGTLKTEPEDWRAALFNGPDSCLIERSSALQHGLKVGDKVKLGRSSLRVAGIISKEPDRAFAGFNLSPRVLITRDLAVKTDLIRYGSRIRRQRLLALPPSPDPARAAQVLKARLEKEFQDPYLHVGAYGETEASVRESLQRVTVFFVLISLVALILGAVGMGAGVTLFLNEQLETVGLLRCLGLEPRSVSRLYHGLCLAIGLQGGLLGIAAGWALSSLGLKVAKRALDLQIEIPDVFDPSNMAQSAALSCVIALAVNWAKVRALAKLSPLDILHERVSRLPPAPWRTAAALVFGAAAVFGYTWAKSRNLPIARDFTLALAAAAFLVSALILGALRLLAAFSGRLTGARAFFARQGLRQLTRSRGRTMVFLFTLSIGFSLLGALDLVRASLSREIMLGQAESVPDLFLVDVQKTQVAPVAALISRFSRGAPDFAPLIRARLTHINGLPAAQGDHSGLSPQERDRRRWLTREYNLTYKDFPNSSEKITAGNFWSAAQAAPQISLEESFAKRIRVSLGDNLRFEIQGRPVEGPVTSLRKVAWSSAKPNFFVVFPTPHLEKAPQIFIASLRVRDAEKSAQFQRELVKNFPNVSVIDVSKILDNVSAVLGTLLKALDVLAWFCVAVGLLVLAGTLSLGQKERRQTAALFRALGCRRSEILRMDAAEFLAVGLATFTISCIVSYGLGYVLSWRMNIEFASAPGELLKTLLSAILMPLAVGLAINWKVYGESVMESFRREA